MGEPTWETDGPRDPYPVVRVEGAPRERGRQLGERARERVDRLAAFCFGRTTRRRIGGAEYDVIELAERLLPGVERFSPDLVEECRGVAGGAGRDVRELLAMQYMVEYGVLSALPPAACSTVLSVGRAPAHSLLGWNDDMPLELAHTAVMLRTEPDRGPAVTGLCFAGAIGECGATRDLCIACNALYGPVVADGVPYLFIQRRALQQPSLPDALAVIRSARRTCCMAYTVMSRDGRYRCLETTPDAVRIVAAGEPVFARTNHYLSDLGAMVAGMPDPGSLRRQAGLTRVLQDDSGALRWDRMAAALGDHADGVCRHGRDATVSGMLCDLTAGRLALSSGPTCLGRFREFDL